MILINGQRRNHDPHQWSKEATAAPVMSQLELWILTSLAVFNHRVLKNCDIKQAFVQSLLPSNEQYFLCSPVGCPRSTPGTYWKLIRSLYGLCHAPCLWFEKLSSHLHGMGLKSSATSPCLFVGHLIDGTPLIHVGIYVDDIIYFSSSNEVERKFEGSLSKIGNVDFMGQVSHFLGIEFMWKHHSNLTVCLTQQSFIETLVESLGFLQASTSHYTTPYCSGMVIDSIPHQDMSSDGRDKLCLNNLLLVVLIGWHKLLYQICLQLSLYWLSIRIILLMDIFNVSGYVTMGGRKGVVRGSHKASPMLKKY
jgi:hypothetical protein